jgi:micrococcal nuclease
MGWGSRFVAAIWPAGLLLLAAPLQAQPVPVTLPCGGLEAGPARTVSRVIDGETVELDDGSQLRLIGVLAPRAFDVGAEPGTWPAEMEAREELKGLVLGRSVIVAFGGARVDRYGRLLGHVFWSNGSRTRWLQRELLERGMARAFTRDGNRACARELLAAEASARMAPRGLWAQPAYQVRRAESVQLLRRYRATFQVVEGVVVRVAQVRSMIYLNFARDWRRGFSVSLRRRDRNLLGAYAGDPRQLEGKPVRVRGWIRQGRNLDIELSQAGDIEVIETAGEGELAPRSPASGALSTHRAAEPERRPPGLIETGR